MKCGVTYKIKEMEERPYGWSKYWVCKECIKKWNCFPGDSRVMTVNGEIQMKDLKV